MSEEEWDLVDSLRDKIETLEEKRLVYTLEQKAGLGVAEGKAPSVKTLSGPKADYSQKHIDRLGAHRTVVMRCYLEQNPDAAEVLFLAELANVTSGDLPRVYFLASKLNT